MLCPLLANAGLLMNTGTPHWRRTFLDAGGVELQLWMVGQFEWTYYEVYLHKPCPTCLQATSFFPATIPLIAALAMRPHLRARRNTHSLGGTWICAAAVVVDVSVRVRVLPWMYATPTPGVTTTITTCWNYIQHLMISGIRLVLAADEGAWRRVYAHLFGASALYMADVRWR